MGEALALGAGCCFALGALFARLGSDHLPSRVGLVVSLISNAFVLFVVSAVVLVVRGMPQPSLVGIMFFSLAGVAGTLIGRWGSIHSAMILGPSRASLYRNLQPLLTTALAVGVLGERLGPIDMLGTLLIVVGMAVANLESMSSASSTERAWVEKPGRRAEGITAGIVAAVGFAVGNALRKVAVDAWPEPVLGALIGVVVAVVGFALGSRTLTIEVLRPPFGRGHLYFGIMGFATAAAQLLFFTSLVLIPVWIANMFVSLEPVLTLIFSAVLFRGRERLNAAAVLSAMIATGGVLVLVVG